MVRFWRNLSIIYKIVIPLFLIIFMGGAASYFILDRMAASLIHEMMLKNVEGDIKEFYENIDRLGRRALESASVISAMDEVHKIYRMEDEDAARDELRSFFTPMAEKV